jgi:hypothetical protein
MGDQGEKIPGPLIPADKDVINAVASIRKEQPGLGRTKIRLRLKEAYNWRLSEARLKKLVPTVNVLRGNADRQALGIPEDALAAQQRYKNDSTRCFKIYGHGESNYGVSPNADRTIQIDIVHEQPSSGDRKSSQATSKMARKKFSKPKGEIRTSFMFPSLHQDVVDAVSDQIASTWFHEKDSDRDSHEEYSTHVMGKFKCNNDACSRDGWGSKKVAILIRGYPRNGYNAVVFNQRCKSCNRLGTLTLDEKSYVDRVAYRLKKWAGILMEEQYYDSKEGPPHESDLCEGCRRGVCRQMND